LTNEYDQLAMLAGGVVADPFTIAAGSEVDALVADDDQDRTEEGHPPDPTGAHLTEPRVPTVVAQLTYAVVWVRSVT
jgi:hypothetical protein